MKQSRWLTSGIALGALGILLLSLPDAIEGPKLLDISEGHGLSLLDSIAILPLIAGATMLEIGIFKRRHRLLEKLSGKPATLILTLFGSGVGVGLLIASAFSGFYWWWALGATLFAVLLVYTAVLAARDT